MEQKINDKSIWCFILLLLFSVITFPLKLYAIPAYDGTFVVNQPSGVSFEAKQHGDEWYNWIETKDGYGISRNSKTGNWEYYVPSADLKAKVQTKLPSGVTSPIIGKVDPVMLGIPKGLRPPKKQLPDTESAKIFKNRLDKKLPSAAVSGSKNLLVIAVDYATTTGTYTPSLIQPLIFGAGDSVADYYKKTSYLSVTINPATETNGTSTDGFVGWLRLSGSHPNTGTSIDFRNQQIAKNAINEADPYINYASYDADDDGVVEPTELSIVIIVAGYEASYSLDSPSVWGHQWDMSSVGNPIVDGKEIQQYAQFGERHGNHLATIGIMAHELGHLMFSLPDLYDTNMLNGSSEGIGAFDLMGSGSWGAASGTNDGSYPTQLSAWSKEYLSWGTVNVISSDQSVSFPKTDGNSSSIFRINTPDSNQYFLLENRQFSGYDAGFQRYTGPSGHGGLVIYHIDKLKTNLWPSSNNVNADENDKGVDVEEANEGSFGSSMLDTNYVRANTNMFFFAGNNGAFTNFTTPDSKLKNGSLTNISVTDISAYSDTMTATISFIADTIPPTVVSTNPANNATDVAINPTIT
ncbi:MAG TPA: M6 family metalloprotease domain-containing protein, partial [Candidatus Brocadiaceae bacterium]